MTTFADIKDTKDFQDFLREYNLALPSRFGLRNNSTRLIDLDNNTNSVFMTFYDEVSAHDGKPFVRVYWYNGKGQVFFRIKGNYKPLSAKEREKRDEEVAKRKAWIEEQRQAQAIRCRDEFFAVGVPLKFHKYLKNKNVFAYYGLRFATQTITETVGDETHIRIAKGDMLIPIISLDKQFMSYQRIDEKGRKLLCRDGAKNLGFYPIGNWNTKTKKVLLCEGYATGATLREATNETVFVCFDVGNVMALARELKLKYPEIEVIICTDYDLDKKQSGLINGLLIAIETGFKFIFPTTVCNGSDWNDLMAETDINTVNRCVFDALEAFKSKSVEEVAKSFYKLLIDENYVKVA